jgi:hypothetical protein
MNKIVAISAAAAVPTIAPAMAADQVNDASKAGDRTAALARMEQIVDLLRTCYVREGWKIDEAAAHRALEYSRQYAKDGSDPDEGREATMDFLRSHGQSLDWAFGGDVGGMICRGAKDSKRANSIADAESIALVDEYILAEQKYCDLNRKVDLMEGETNHRRKPVPDALNWRDSDAKLGLPSLWHSSEDHPPIWDRPIDVNQIRDATWTVCSKYAVEGETSVTLRDVIPSVAARARADEIIAAFDEWQKEGKPSRGYKTAVRETDKAYRASERLEAQIAETPATSLEGMRAKIRCAQAFECDDEIGSIDSGGATEAMALSIFNDILRLTAASA